MARKKVINRKKPGDNKPLMADGGLPKRKGNTGPIAKVKTDKGYTYNVKPNGKMATGRPRKIVGDLEKKLFTFLQMGLSVAEACKMCKVSTVCFNDRKRGDKQFSDDADYYMTHTVSLAKRAVYRELNSDNCDPKFALDYLKRKCKDEFGDDVTMHHDGNAIALPFGGIEPISDSFRERLGIAPLPPISDDSSGE